MESSLLEFLRQRNIDEACISQLDKDKIDTTVIPLMSDHDLEKYIPRNGDRVAVLAFCHQNQSPDNIDRKSHLLEKVRSKICNPSTKRKQRDNMSEKHKGNTYAKKINRRVELGWMVYSEDEDEFKQVRRAKGGGTRHLTVERNTTIQVIKTLAENLFFPEGKSKDLELKDYYSEMRDIQQMPIDEECTVDELYEKTKVRLLRVYLCTKKKEKDIYDKESDYIITLSPDKTPDEEELQQYVPLYFLDEEWNITNRTEPETMQTSTDVENSPTVIDNQHEDSTGEVFIGPVLHENEVSNLNDTIPLEDMHSLVIVVRRGFCLTDLMAAFGDPSIMTKDLTIRMKLPNGSLEKGTGTGVFRDCLCEFWTEFYNRCTVGASVKVPFLRHEFQAHEWQCIGRILAKGWLTVGYFPIRFSLPFLDEALYGETYSSIRESFMLYISKPDRDILEQALTNFESVDQEALIDVLDSHECHQIPSAENICALVTQLGHKALIQTPMSVIECWRPVLTAISETLRPQQLEEIVQQQVPTPKRVKDILNFPQSMNATQSNVARHLRRYVGELDETTLQLFLRFCTGADVLFGSHITVNFIETSECQCRPQANTCGCYLNLPINYQNYPDLRSDFNAILNSSVWAMDIV